MPLLKPDIQKALREANLLPEQRQGTIEDSLDNAGLSLDSTLGTLSDLATNGSSEHIRLRATEMTFKMRGFMKEQSSPAPSITIVIQDGSPAGKMNPILVPREVVEV